MSRIAIGVVHHAKLGVSPSIASTEMELLTRVNANEDDHTPWKGFGANHNELMGRTEAPWYVALNPDVRVGVEDLICLVRSADAAGFAIVGPAVASPWGMITRANRGFPSPMVWLQEALFGAQRRLKPPDHDSAVTPSAWVTGACIAIRRDLGLRFDERYFMYFEDADLCRRAQGRGMRVGLCTSVVVEHRSGWAGDDTLLKRRGVEFARSAMLFAQTYGESALAMRVAGLIRFGSRRFVGGRVPAERAASWSITRGFANPGLPGLAELAAAFDQRG
jgi:GT2 family glycosyltransferase